MWTSKNLSDQKWRRKVIDLRRRRVIWHSEVTRHFDWDAFLEEIISSKAFDGEIDVRWKFGAVRLNRSVELGDADSGHQSDYEWQISIGEEHGSLLARLDCASRSSDGGTIRAAASLGFDSEVKSIAAGWIRSEAGGRRRAIVACRLDGRSYPAIMRLYPAND